MSRGGKKNKNSNYKKKDKQEVKAPVKNISKKEKAKRKKLIIAAVVIAVALVGGLITYSALNPIKVKTSSIVLEYGEAIPLKPSYYLSDETKEDVAKETLVILENASMDENGCQKPGEYKVTLRADKWTKNVNLIVKEKEEEK